MSLSVAGEAKPLNWNWLRSARFDLFFILGIVALAIGTGAIVIAVPDLFVPILILDLWFLGYHHIISTYTRLCFDRKSLQNSRFLVFGLLPPGRHWHVADRGGRWPVGDRQRVFLLAVVPLRPPELGDLTRLPRQGPRALHEDGWLDQAIFYAIPVLGVLFRSHQDSGTFIGMELWMFPAPEWLVFLGAVGTGVLLIIWLVRRLQAARLGGFRPSTRSTC